MAAYILARLGLAEAREARGDLAAIAALLRWSSTEQFAGLGGFDPDTAMPPQTRAATALFASRSFTEPERVYFSLGAMLTVEFFANRHIIPGEKAAFVDSRRYHRTLADPEMHYLAERWGELGAEHAHEALIRRVIDQLADPRALAAVDQGVSEACQRIESFYDLLYTTLLQSGIHSQPAR